MPQDNENRVYYTSIKPGVREILLGKKFSEIKKILNKKYNIKFVDDRADIFTGDLNIKAFIEKYSPVLTYLRSYRGWKYGKLLKFMENNIFKSFLEPVGRDEWLESDYPVRFKRWKRYRIMLKNFNPFVRRVDLAFYKNVLYYAKFYVKNHYRFNDTYLPKNEEKFLQHLYLKFKRIYGQPILFNNYQYHWRDNKVELALDGKNSTLTFTDYRTDKLVVRYLKNVSIVLARMQMRILNQADYVDKYLKDFE
jgi:hypothetical protein